MLVDAQWRGEPRKLLLHADRNGFFYVLDRTNGKVLLATAFARQTWTSGIAPDGRPLPPPDNNSALECPGSAANWNSASYSPSTKLFYVLAEEECRVSRRQLASQDKAPDPAPAQKFVRAIDMASGRIVWEIPLVGKVIAKTWPGILATAGGLVFYADPNGAFAAADQQRGETLWHFATNVYMKASPMTFTVDARQFVAVAAGPNVLCFGLP